MSLSPEARSLIDAARREAQGPSEASRARMRRKVLSAAGAGALASAASSTAAAAGAATKLGFFASLGLSSKIGLGLLVAGAAVGGAQAVWSEPTPSAPPAGLVAAPVGATARPPAPVAAPAPELVAPTSEPALELEPSASAAATHARRAPPAVAPGARRPPPSSATELSPPSTPPASEADALREELALIGAAQSSLGAGRSEAALASLDEHARRFPSGALSLERRALRALALCAGGRLDEGRAEAEAFTLRAPGSPLAERVSSACR